MYKFVYIRDEKFMYLNFHKMLVQTLSAPLKYDHKRFAGVSESNFILLYISYKLINRTSITLADSVFSRVAGPTSLR